MFRFLVSHFKDKATFRAFTNPQDLQGQIMPGQQLFDLSRQES